MDPPPFEMPHTVGWFRTGTRPGAEGAALLVGHVDTATKPAVFYGLSSARPGETVNVTRTDGTVAEFTIDDVQVFPGSASTPGRCTGSARPTGPNCV